MRLQGKTAVVVGGGQAPGEGIGNGRATALVFAREGARVLVGDRDLESAQQTVELITKAGGTAEAYRVDVRSDDDCKGLIATCLERWGRIDILHNNVGIGRGDNTVASITDDAWDLIFEVNVRGAMHTCRHALPAMRAAEAGVILNVSSIASICAVANLVAYKSSKAALNAMTHSIALGNAKYGIRANAILPGLMNTPMAVDGISKARGVEREKLIEQRDAQVPLRGGMGSAWDVANAALFLASDEARFITGVMLPVDGGQSARVG